MGLSMGPITQDLGPELRQAEARVQFLPAESPLLMSSQQLRAFRQTEPGARTPGHMRLRRAFIFISTVALTSAGCYEMYEVVQVGGVTILEWMVLVLFVMLFAWIAFSFCSALAGFAVLLFASRDPLGIDTAKLFRRSSVEMPCYCRSTTRIPTASWGAYRQCTNRSINSDIAQASTGSC
jgi:membrane glycosyltransferase